MKPYLSLVKFTLLFLVVFSYVVSFLLASPSEVSIVQIFLIVVAGGLITGAANAANQLIEKDTDALMLRTKHRPLVMGSLSIRSVKIFIVSTLLIGVAILVFFFNEKVALLSLLSFFLYVYVYTPMKRTSSFSVFVGAVPGSLPCLIGWVAATNSFGIYGWVLFAIQFFWQFPHFWSLAWLVNEDYNRAGYRLLPFGMGPSRLVAFQTLTFSAVLMVVSMIPYLMGKIGVWGVLPITIANVILLLCAVALCVSPSSLNARRVMFACYIYLPVVFLSIFLFNKHV